MTHDFLFFTVGVVVVVCTVVAIAWSWVMMRIVYKLEERIETIAGFIVEISTILVDKTENDREE